MKTTQFTAHDWLRHEAHLTASGHPFQFNDCSYLPVAPNDEQFPSGFLMTHGQDVQFVPADSEAGQEIAAFWGKTRFVGVFENPELVPTEYWIG